MSGVWDDEEAARLRALLDRSLARVPGGAAVLGSGLGALLAVGLTLVAVLVPAGQPLAALALLAAGAGLLPSLGSHGPRLLPWSLAALTVLAAAGEVGLWLRGERSFVASAGQALLLGAGVGVAFVVAARHRRLTRTLAVAQAAVDAVSVRDALTGVANRAGLDLVGRQVVETARRQGDAAHCTFVEIGGLGEARTLHGPDAVADVLVALAEALRSVTRTTDVVARWKDAVFVVVGQGAGMDPAELERRVRRRLGADAALDRDVWSGRITIGGAMLPPWDSGTLDTLVQRAEEELRARQVPRTPPAERPLPHQNPASGRPESR